MADVTKMVDPDNGAGTDYTSLNAWASNEAADLVSAGDTHTVNCRSSSGSDDTTPVTISGWTTDSTHDLTIRQADSDRHDGTFNASKYVHATTGDPLMFSSGWITVDGVQFKKTDSAYTIESYNWSSTILHLTIKNCLFDCINRTGWTTILYADGTATTASVYIIQNCLFFNFAGGNNVTAIALSQAAASMYAYHNTIYGAYRGISYGAGTILAVNNLCRAITGAAFYGGTFDSSSDYNSSNESSAAAINSTQTSGSPWNSSGDLDSDYFNDASSDDFTTPSGGLQIDAGYDLSGTVDDDAIGTTRPQGSDFDLGYIEYTSAGSSYYESLTLGVNVSQSGAAALIMDASLTLSSSAGISEGSQADLVGTVELPAVVSQAQSAVGDLLTSLDLDVTADISLAAALIMGASIALDISAGISQEGTVGAQTYEETLALAINAGLDPAGALVMAASVSLGISAGMSQSAGLLLEAMATLSAVASQAQSTTQDHTVGISLEALTTLSAAGTLEIDASLVLASVAQMLQAGNIEGATVLAHEFVIYLSQKSHDTEISQKTHPSTLSQNDHDLVN